MLTAAMVSAAVRKSERKELRAESIFQARDSAEFTPTAANRVRVKIHCSFTFGASRERW